MNNLEAERDVLIAKMCEIANEILYIFNSSEKRDLTDVEAAEHYFNADFGKESIHRFRILDSEIVMCEDMGDFKLGIAVPFSEFLEQMIVNYYCFDEELCNLN